MKREFLAAFNKQASNNVMDRQEVNTIHRYSSRKVYRSPRWQALNRIQSKGGLAYFWKAWLLGPSSSSPFHCQIPIAPVYMIIARMVLQFSTSMEVSSVVHMLGCKPIHFYQCRTSLNRSVGPRWAELTDVTNYCKLTQVQHCVNVWLCHLTMVLQVW